MKWKLSACRVQAGFTQLEVAQILGCSAKSIVDYENGYNTPRVERGRKLAELYGIPMDMIDFSKAGNTLLSKEEQEKRVARLLPDDEVVEV